MYSCKELYETCTSRTTEMQNKGLTPWEFLAQSFLGTMFMNQIVSTDTLNLWYAAGKTHPMWILGIVFLYSAVKHLLSWICHSLAGNTWKGGVWTLGAEYCRGWSRRGGSRYFQERKYLDRGIFKEENLALKNSDDNASNHAGGNLETLFDLKTG